MVSFLYSFETMANTHSFQKTCYLNTSLSHNYVTGYCIVKLRFLILQLVSLGLLSVLFPLTGITVLHPTVRTHTA